MSGVMRKGRDVARVARLDEDRLPDAAGRRVPLPLLADGLLGVVHRVLHAQDDHAPALRVERVGQVELERRVAALVPSERLAVAPAFGEEIRRADRQDHAFAGPRRARRAGCGFRAGTSRPRSAARSGGWCGPRSSGRGKRAWRSSDRCRRNRPAPTPRAIPSRTARGSVRPHGPLARLEPAFVHAEPFAVEAEIPRAVEVEPVHALDAPALAVGARVFGAGKFGAVEHGGRRRNPVLSRRGCTSAKSL